jgi:hypothetical protein
VLTTDATETDPPEAIGGALGLEGTMDNPKDIGREHPEILSRHPQNSALGKSTTAHLRKSGLDSAWRDGRLEVGVLEGSPALLEQPPKTHPKGEISGESRGGEVPLEGNLEHPPKTGWIGRERR